MSHELLYRLVKEIKESCTSSEGVGGYRIGGYRQVIPFESALEGENSKRKYTPVRKLGWGHFSTVWEVYLKYIYFLFHFHFHFFFYYDDFL